MSDFAEAGRRRLDGIAWHFLSRLQRGIESLLRPRVGISDEMVLIGSSSLFDADWYSERYPASRAYRGGACLHYLNIGWRLGYNPGPIFDGPAYLTNNPDVAAAGDYNPLLHFIRHGAKEGRVIGLQETSEPRSLLEIKSPGDWDEVEDCPVLIIRSDVKNTAKVEYFKIAIYFADPAEAVPEVMFDVLLEKKDANLCKCPLPLQDGPYVVRLSCQGDQIVHGVKVNSYRRFATDFTAFSAAQRNVVEMQLDELRTHCSAMMIKPDFVFILAGAGCYEYERTLRSLKIQIYDVWSVYDETSYRGKVKTGDWLVFLYQGDVVESDFLYRYACAINQREESNLIYCDCHQKEEDGSTSQFYKPAWSPDYLESYNYIGRGAAFKVQDDHFLDRSSSYSDFVLRFTEGDIAASHVERTLVSLCANPVTGFMAEGLNAKVAREGRLARTNRQGDVTPLDRAPSFFKINIIPQTFPKVSIVIPTAGKVIDIDGRRIDLVLNLIAGIELDGYPNYEILVIHNGNLSNFQMHELKRMGAKLVHFEEKDFNISKKLNLGATHAKGELLLLLNDDIEPLSRSWISSMASHFQKRHVGIVGVKLLYVDHSVQHVGVVQNYGNCDHVCRGLGADEFGYYGCASVARNYSAVTGACVMMKTSIFQSLGGFNENLAISFNDVDFCFKVRSLGMSVVCDASIELYHFESSSRVPELDISELEVFTNAWPQVLAVDPFYNERMLDVCPPSFTPNAKKRML